MYVRSNNEKADVLVVVDIHCVTTYTIKQQPANQLAN